MNILRKLTPFALLTTAVLTLTGCGGSENYPNTNNNSDNTSHPEFSWAKVAVSNNYSPSGEITDLTPTFSWKAVSNATVYNFGHESTNGTDDWKEYTIPAAEAGCAIGSMCSYKPANHIFNVGDQKVWWVRGKVANQWLGWSSAHVFKVVNTGAAPTSSIPISPKNITLKNITLKDKLTFEWSTLDNAKNYVVGIEKSDGSKWQSFTISGKNSHSYTLNSPLNKGDYTWWVRAELTDGTWTNWSDGADFKIDTNNQVKPFPNNPDTHDIVKVDKAWFGISGNSILKSDGTTISTVFTSPVTIDSTLYSNISGKIHFVSTQSAIKYSRPVQQLISINTTNNKQEVVLESTEIKIIQGMKDYLYLSYNIHRKWSPDIDVKVDKNNSVIEISRNSFGRASSTRNTIMQINSQTNELFLLRSYSSSGLLGRGIRGRHAYYKITDAIGLGREYAKMPTYLIPVSGLTIDLQLYANALDLRWHGIGQSTTPVRYDIYRRDLKNSYSSIKIGSVNASLGASPNFYDTTIQRGKTYRYYITRTDSANRKALSQNTITIDIPK